MRKYLKESVYEAAMERIKFIFDEFDMVLAGFSGGKDSTVSMDMCYDYARQHGQLDRLAMYHLDHEAQYQMTTDYVEWAFHQYPGIKKFWLCLPVETKCACRMDGAHWTPWAPEQQAIWVREMPDSPYVINQDNAQFPVERGVTGKQMQKIFQDWFISLYGKTAVVAGIRCEESYDRMKIVTQTARSLRYKNQIWTIASPKKSFAYILYDWRVEDIWTYLGRTGYRYNRLYDLYYQAGLRLRDMRVASPFHDCGIHNLALYKIIDPDNWGRMVGRVNGANFAGLYGDTSAMGYRKLVLPTGYSWQRYYEFLLTTLDEKTKKHYEKMYQKLPLDEDSFRTRCIGIMKNDYGGLFLRTTTRRDRAASIERYKDL